MKLEFVIDVVKDIGREYKTHWVTIHKGLSAIECRHFIMVQLNKRQTDLVRIARRMEVSPLKEWIDAPTNYLNGYMSTKCGRFKHIMMYDCDTKISAQYIEHDLARRRIDYIVWESTLERFWVFSDEVGFNVRRMVDQAENLMINAGCDLEYATQCRKRGRFIVRAYPKNFRLPECRTIKSRRFSKKVSKAFVQWTAAFAKYWKSPGVEKLRDESFVAAI